MHTTSRGRYRNQLLLDCDGDTIATLTPYLEYVCLPMGYMLAGHSFCSDHVFFIETGVAATVTWTSKGASVETGLFGRESLAPLDRVLGSDRTPSKSIMQVSGSAWRIRASDLAVLIDRLPELRRVVWRYAHDLMTQIASTALSNAVNTIEERLARWLLMFCDRFGHNELPLTHATMAGMLGVRRSSIAEALHTLECEGFIQAERGSVTIRDHAGMKAFTDEPSGKKTVADSGCVPDMLPVQGYKPARAAFNFRGTPGPSR